MGHLYLFTAFMFTRVPSWREHLDRLLSHVVKEGQLSRARDKDRFHKLCEEFEKETGEALGMDCEELRQHVLRGEYEVVQGSTAFNLGSMFESALNVARELQTFGYEIVYAPRNDFFLTSDSPVFTLQPDGAGEAGIGMGFGWPGVEVYFPLNKLACLRLKRGMEPGARGLTSPSVAQINQVTMMNATRHLYSCEGYRRISWLFDQWGCKIEPGKNAFMPKPELPKQPNRH
jgi:Protein of unknown function (DUF4238)